MHIAITQILEGGIDLQTMQEIPRSATLQLGGMTALMPITDEQLGILMSLIGVRAEPPPVPKSTPPPALVSAAPSASDDYDDPDTGLGAY